MLWPLESIRKCCDCIHCIRYGIVWRVEIDRIVTALPHQLTLPQELIQHTQYITSHPTNVKKFLGISLPYIYPIFTLYLPCHAILEGRLTL